MKNLVWLLLVTMVWVGCDSDNSSTEKVEVTKREPQNEMVFNQMSKGFQVMESYCISCHAWNPEKNQNLAPSFGQIKKVYAEKAPDLKDFQTILNTYLENPGLNTAQVSDWAHVYGVMPKFDLTPEEIEAVGVYLYHSPFEKEDWFTTFYPEDKKNFSGVEEEVSYVELGKKYALQTKAILGKNLKGTIKKEGTHAAVSFCNERAYPLTDSMSAVLNTQIKRVSDQTRNPGNQANELELSYIQSAKSTLASGGKIKPQMQELNGKMIGYYPITTNAMCLQCHGVEGEQIKPDVSMNIKSLYPDDLATGYGENQLRGIWVVQMDKVD